MDEAGLGLLIELPLRTGWSEHSTHPHSEGENCLQEEGRARGTFPATFSPISELSPFGLGHSLGGSSGGVSSWQSSLYIMATLIEGLFCARCYFRYSPNY